MTEIVFSAADNLTVEEDAFMGLEKLSKITFGEIGVIKSSTGYEADLPSLKELVFNDITHSLAFTSRAFRNADIEKIVLPANLSEVEGLPAFSSMTAFYMKRAAAICILRLTLCERRRAVIR